MKTRMKLNNKTALDESRLLIFGAQVLFGFAFLSETVQADS
jgi:hypothetical protein